MDISGKIVVKALPNKNLPRDFSKAVKLLKRPYFYISKNDYESLLVAASTFNTDIFEDDDGQQYTIGSCDGGQYALMPLIKNI